MAALERVSAERRAISQRRAGLTLYAQRVTELRARLADETAWRDVLREAQKTLEAQLAALEGLPPRERNERYQQDQDLRAALNQIQRGVEWVGSFSMISPALYNYLREAGVRPKDGYGSNPWSGRSALPATEERIAETQKALDDAQACIDKELATEL